MRTKERLLRLCAVCAVGICLTGCGASEKAEESTVVSKQEKTSETARKTQTDAEVRNKGRNAWKYTLQCTDAVQGEVQAQDEYVHDYRKALYDQEAVKAYQAFLDGKESAVSLSDNKKYSMNDLIHQVERNDGSGEYIVEEVSYAFIDLGNDNMPELQIYISGNISNMAALCAYFILGYQDTALQIVDSGREEGRSYVDINYYGIINNYGSSGAASGGETVFILDADGQHKELYDLSYDDFYGLENNWFQFNAWTIDSRHYITYFEDQMISSADRKECLQYVSSDDSYYWSDHSEVKEVTQEEIDALIDQKAEAEGVLDLWKAEAPELEWHEWKLP